MQLFSERRSKRRYQIELPVGYSGLNEDLLRISGAGLTRDISSGGLVFATEAQLPTGSAIELWLTWPTIDAMTEVELRVVGRVVRSTPTDTAIQIKRHDFATFPKNTNNRAESRLGTAIRHR
jgi:hypothetical protein